MHFSIMIYSILMDLLCENLSMVFVKSNIEKKMIAVQCRYLKHSLITTFDFNLTFSF